MRSAVTDTARGRWRIRVGAIFAACLLLGMFALGADTLRPAEAQTDNQCVVCHTSAATLKALTPPDPPAAEEGEG